MPDAHYTIDDSPAVVARIEADLSCITATVKAADPALRSLILTGAFARGEGAMLDGAPQNDYDLIALRGLRRPRVPYATLRRALEAHLGLHVDLAPVAAWRLRWAAPSIFWYETALRGRVLWGEDLLERIRTREADKLDPGEGMRLLVNRAAGLLLVTDVNNAHAHRIQAAKGLLAALDAHLLSQGAFAPSQTERMARFETLLGTGAASPALVALAPWFAWAFRFKVDPGASTRRNPREAWGAAADAILQAVPVALRHARIHSLAAYERRDGWIDRAIYLFRSGTIPGAHRFVTHPTARLRGATLRLLEASLDGVVRPTAAQTYLGRLAPVGDRPLQVLERLRGATLQ